MVRGFILYIGILCLHMIYNSIYKQHFILYVKLAAGGTHLFTKTLVLVFISWQNKAKKICQPYWKLFSDPAY